MTEDDLFIRLIDKIIASSTIEEVPNKTGYKSTETEKDFNTKKQSMNVMSENDKHMEEIEKLTERIRFYKDELYKEQKKNEEASMYYGSNIIPSHDDEVLAFNNDGPFLVYYSRVEKCWCDVYNFPIGQTNFVWQTIKLPK